MSLEVTIHTGGAAPIYRQIADAVRLSIARGTLAEGEQLPSVRALAEQLVVNPNTVARAYGDLTREGILDGQPGKGLFVSKPRRIYTNAERLRRLEPTIEALIHQAVALDFTPDEIVRAIERKFQQLNLIPSREKGNS